MKTCKTCKHFLSAGKQYYIANAGWCCCRENFLPIKPDEDTDRRYPKKRESDTCEHYTEEKLT